MTTLDELTIEYNELISKHESCLSNGDIEGADNARCQAGEIHEEILKRKNYVGEEPYHFD